MLSVVSYPQRGIGGNNNYRGNCSPKLIEDIINQYKIKSLNDYMVGSGTTEDVCKRMNVAGNFYDLNRGFDLLSMEIPDNPENIFWHPPYDNLVVYSDEMYKADDIISKYGFDPRINDLSRCRDWDDFVKKMNYCCLKQFTALQEGGRMFILMGDIKKKGKLYSMLCDIIKPGTLEQIIIKMQHNCMSDRNIYSNRNFVSIVHEYLLVLMKESAKIFNIKFTKDILLDIRDSLTARWRDVVSAVMERGKIFTLKMIYSLIEGHKKTKNNKHWREKVRQVLRAFPEFICVGRGLYTLA